MKYLLTVTASETGVKDGVRRTVTRAECEGCSVEFSGTDDLLLARGTQLELTAFPVRKARKPDESKPPQG